MLRVYLFGITIWEDFLGFNKKQLADANVFQNLSLFIQLGNGTDFSRSFMFGRIQIKERVCEHFLKCTTITMTELKTQILTLVVEIAICTTLLSAEPIAALV